MTMANNPYNWNRCGRLGWPIEIPQQKAYMYSIRVYKVIERKVHAAWEHEYILPEN